MLLIRVYSVCMSTSNAARSTAPFSNRIFPSVTSCLPSISHRCLIYHPHDDGSSASDWPRSTSRHQDSTCRHWLPSSLMMMWQHTDTFSGSGLDRVHPGEARNELRQQCATTSQTSLGSCINHHQCDCRVKKGWPESTKQPFRSNKLPLTLRQYSPKVEKNW